MRQSRAEAGLIGMLSESRLQIMASQGYEDYMATLSDHTMKIELPSMQAAMESGQPQRVVFGPGSGSGNLSSNVSQFVVPIRRELQVIGLLMLESSIDTQEKEAPFLNRLSDHAAIAISNAQLYSEVQRANIAKSDFVSFVAHELKNPMTSIKGYTELIAGGKVGPISAIMPRSKRDVSGLSLKPQKWRNCLMTSSARPNVKLRIKNKRFQ
jgi:signal transduction histidine kinase